MVLHLGRQGAVMVGTFWSRFPNRDPTGGTLHKDMIPER